jgi:alpha-1,2-mannosyltransferase
MAPAGSLPARRGVHLLAWLPAAVLAFIQSYAALTRPEHDRLADLGVYLGGVEYLVNGLSLYDFITANDAPFTYPPFAALLMLPLVYLDETVLRFAWTALTVVAVWWMAIVVSRVVGERVPANLTPWLPHITAAILFASAPVSSNIRFGQVSVFLALLILIDLVTPSPRRFSGALTGLSAAIKLTPLIFVPMVWLGGRRRATVAATLAFFGATALALIVLFDDSLRYWGTELLNVDRVGHITTGGNQSVNGALLRLGVPESTRLAIWLASSTIVGVVALWRSARLARAGDWFSAVVVTGAASIAISPVSWTHHQIWLVLAALLPVAGPPARRIAWIAIVLTIMIVPVTSLGSKLPSVLGVVGGELRGLLAVVAACLVPLAFSARQR